jgi:hypothetical protein
VFPDKFPVGRDGLTHNMLEMVHCHWRRQEVCKVRCRGVPTVDMNNLCYHLEVSIRSLLLCINVQLCTSTCVPAYQASGDAIAPCKIISLAQGRLNSVMCTSMQNMVSSTLQC